MATSPTATSATEAPTVVRDPAHDDAGVRERSKRVRRTALLVGGIALAIYLAFILSGVVGR